MSDHIYWIVDSSIRPGQFDNFKVLMKEMVEATQANEPNTLNYEWNVSEDNISCHIFERYTDSAAAITHLSTFGEKFAERFMAVLEPKGFVVYGNPNDTLTEILSSSGAVFMKPSDGFSR